MKITMCLCVLLLTGCATLERHPIAAAVVVGIAAGSIAASSSHHTDAGTGMAPAICRTNPTACQ